MTSSSPAGSPPTPEPAPRLDEVLRSLTGAAQLMAGRTEGLQRLDLSADGFWTSFFAMVVALPPAVLSWMEYETVERADAPARSGDAFVYLAHALADLLAWILPVILLMLIAKRIGFSRKIVPLVVATNWGGALLAWAMAPYWLLVMAAGNSGAMAALGLAATAVSVALTFRLTATALGNDTPAAAGIVILMVLSSLVSYGVVMDVTGLRLA